mgnify:FL=1
MPCTLLHAADIHLGYAQYGLEERQRDYYLAFRHMAEDAIARQVDVVLLAGDLFHKRTVDANTLYQAVVVLELLRDAGITVVAVEGNHERPHYREPLSWLDFLAQRDLLVVLTPQWLEGRLHLLPWDQHERRGAYLDLAPNLRIVGCRYVGTSTPSVVADLATAIPSLPEAETRQTILMLHAGMEGVLDAYGGTLCENDLLPLRGWVQYVALGHIHKPYERLDWVYNPGSLEATSATEAEWTDRGYYIVRVDADRGPHLPPEKIVIPNRPFVRLVCHVEGLSRPSQLWEAVRGIAAAASSGDENDLPPIVELTLRGQLGFARAALETERLQAILQETFDPLVARVRDLTTVEPGEISLAVELSRHELAQLVLRELIAKDTRLNALAEPLTHLALTLQEMTANDPEPSEIVATLDRWQEQHGRPFAQPDETAQQDEA